MSIRRVKPGQGLRIYANDFNAFADAAEAHQRRRAAPPNVVRSDDERSVVRAWNNTETDLEPGWAAKISGVAAEPADDLGAFLRPGPMVTIEPADADTTDELVVLIDPINAGEIGRVAVAGLAAARVSGEGEYVTPGTTGPLAAATRGYRLLWSETTDPTDAERWGLVRLEPVGHHAFPAEIGTATSDGTDRWSYAFDEVELSAAGYASWATRTGGTSGTARNLSELGNASGVAGGVDTGGADYPAGFSAQPVASGTVVMMHPIRAGDGTLTYWFEHGPTAHDGTCS